jgi:hypothetical protein
LREPSEEAEASESSVPLFSSLFVERDASRDFFFQELLERVGEVGGGGGLAGLIRGLRYIQGPSDTPCEMIVYIL